MAARVHDGSTLQAGIGAVPDATLGGLRDRRGLGVWTEMFSDSVLELEKAGALDHERRITTSFLFGSPELYAWVDGNPRVRMARTETTNHPSAIARNRAMTWHPRADRSTIVPLVDEPVTSFQMTAVVTEQGVAGIFGHDHGAQARNLIEHAAHPDVREELWEEARALSLA